MINAAPETPESLEAVARWWQSDLARTWLIEKPLRILIVLLIAVVLQWLARRLINKMSQTKIQTPFGKKIDTNGNDALREAQEARRRSRMKTLASVFNSAAAIIIWVWAALAILAEFDVNVGPLIASAGIVGVALGFGAQSLVKDFLSGIFMLLEDQYGVGDTIDVGDGIVGDVEDISLRITTLRDIDGTLWYVRNGEILRVGNMSDDFSIARIEIPLALTNDTEQAWDIILDATKEAAKDPAIADAVLDEPHMNGLTEINPDYVTYRLSIKTLPSRQWDVQRTIQSKLVNSMRKAGLTMPYPHGINLLRAAGQKDKE